VKTGEKTMSEPCGLRHEDKYKFDVIFNNRFCSIFNGIFHGIFNNKFDIIFNDIFNKIYNTIFNPLKPELNPICSLLALLGAHHFLHVSRIRVKLLTYRLLMSYIYGAPILDVSRSHTTTQHSR